MVENIKILPVFETLKSAFFEMNKRQHEWHIFWFSHLAFCVLFNLLPNGFSNPFSLLWAVGYYVFWCVFFRFYYQKKPYLSWRKVFSSAIPSSKMVFITFLLMFFLLMVPYIPLLMGFNNKYLTFFEHYMEALQAPETSLLNVTIFSIIFLFLSPIAFVKPYLAWISALQGYSGSIRKVFKKTKGNYFAFLKLMFFLNLPCFFIYQADTLLNCHGWFSVGFYSIYLIYANIVFAKVYDWFNS